jgi:hypothetical protein
MLMAREISDSVPSHPAPIEALKQQNPGLFESPEWWLTRGEHILRLAGEVRKGQSRIIGRSAGGREIPVFSYGEFEPVTSTATISSAMASDRPGSFYDPATRKKPSLTLIGSIHGGEAEGVALCMSLIRLLETGKDWRGGERPTLVEKMGRVRLNLLPCLNLDGRAAAAVDHLNGAEIEELFLVQQGLLADGTPFKGRKVKETQPIPPGFLKFMGGYYNADGVNLQHDDFFGPRIAPENEAVRTLFREEIPDAFLTLHAHGAHPAFLTPDAFLSPGVQRKQVEAAGYISAQLQRRNIAFFPPDHIVTPPWSFFFQTWLHHMTGATPLLFEFNHGLKISPLPLGDIMETGYVVFEAWLDYCLTFGARPKSHELFGSITPA